MLFPVILISLLANVVFAAPLFFTGNTSVDGAIAGAGIGFLAGKFDYM